LLIDPKKFHDPLFGPFGQVSLFEGLSGITHNGSILYDGKFTHRG